MSILLIDCYLDPKGGAGSFLPYLPRNTFVWHVSQGEPHPDIHRITDISGVVITGSAACVHDQDEWVTRLLVNMEGFVAHDIPCFGVCFGHQALAKIAGAQVGILSPPEVGWKRVKQSKQNLLWSNISPEIDVFLSHRDAVLEAGETLDVLAFSEECGVQAFQYKKKPVWGIQFHPEMPVEECAELLEYRRNLHPELELDWEREHALLRSNSMLAKQFFQNFLAFVSKN